MKCAILMSQMWSIEGNKERRNQNQLRYSGTAGRGGQLGVTSLCNIVQSSAEQVKIQMRNDCAMRSFNRKRYSKDDCNYDVCVPFASVCHGAREIC